jgi:hypothetical protein
MRHSFTITFTALALFISFFLFTGHKSNASHLIGGDISYEYIGDSTNTPHHYLIKVRLIRTTKYTILNLASSYQVCTRSSCFPNQNIQVTYPQGFPTTGNLISDEYLCIDISSPEYAELYEHIYTGTVILPGTCSDFVFSHSMVCCRVNIPEITNYSGFGSGGSTNYLEVTLNNTIGNNSSPQFLPRTSPYGFCHNQDVTINQTTFDPDGDSISYRLERAKNGPLCGPGQDMVLDSGYTVFQPFPHAPGSPLTISNQGVMNFTSGNVSGNFIYVLIIEDFRYMPAFNDYIKIGSSYREEWISFSDECLENIQRGPRLSDTTYSFENFPADFLNRLTTPHLVPNADTTYNPSNPAQYQLGLFVADYNCLSTEIDLYFDQPILCSSIDAGGSDFRILSPDTINIPVIIAHSNCDSSNYTQHITLELLESLPENGDFLITIRTGYDNNTLINFCGFETPPYYTLVLRSTNCPIVSTQSFSENTFRAKLFPNPNTGQFTIALNQSTTAALMVTIFDLRGVQVMQMPMHPSGEMPIDGNTLASGQYIVRIENLKTGTGKNLKLVKQ